MDLLPALRDLEGDLANWRFNPLCPLIENAVKNIDQSELEAIGKAIEDATAKITEFDEVSDLEGEIGKLFAQMSGPRQDIEPRLGFSPTETSRLYRNIRLLIDGGLRGIAEASLGSANLVFLSLKALETKQLIEQGSRDHTLLAIEEPEAHLHPHLQRSVYRHLFESVEVEGSGETVLSVLLTTHSPHIVSVAPLRSLVLLRDAGDHGTIGYSAAAIFLSDDEVDDLARYLDVTRAEIFSPVASYLWRATQSDFWFPFLLTRKSFDKLGITVCSVAGTNFVPYVKFLGGLGIPFSVITDWDPRDGATPLGCNRALRLATIIEEIRTGKTATKLIAELKALALDDYDKFSSRCEDFGVFTNIHTLEIDLFKENGDFCEAVIETLREGPFGPALGGMDRPVEKKPQELDPQNFSALIDEIGKGRFAQRLAARIGHLNPPVYIADAIKFIADRV